MSYFTRNGEIRAVDGVNLIVNSGDVLGLAGESGCGKSTLALSILRLIKPPGKIIRGEVNIEGHDVLKMSSGQLRGFRWKECSMVFQGAMNSLNPVYRIGKQINEAIFAHDRVSKEEADAKARELLEKVGMEPDLVRSYPHELSGGMKQRVVIAMALALTPKLLIADEPTTALDVVVQRQIMELLMDLKRNLGLSIIFITHDLAVMAAISSRIGIMYAGKLVEVADRNSIFMEPLHPYTEGLISSIPVIGKKREKLHSIPGAPPNLLNPPSGCGFYPRCSFAMSRCRDEQPDLVNVDANHLIACFRVER